MTRYENTKVRPGATELTEGVVGEGRDMSAFSISAVLGFGAFSVSYLAAMAWIPWMSRSTAVATVVLSLLVCLGVAVITYRSLSNRETSGA